MEVRVRFAPSPTGYLHVGGLRTALYNYLFARKHGGKCILRIEDTDRTRFVEKATENLIENLSWAGIEFDESLIKGGKYGPYVQSERFPLYREHANKLIKSDKAYYAFDTAEEIDAMRQRQQAAGLAPKYDRSAMRNQYTLGEAETKRLLGEGHQHVVRLKVPQMELISFQDIIRSDVSVHGKDIDDQILLKSDGFPTYHLANVVDDHLMEITHVIRGEEWLPSTPKHVILYDAFGWERPQFAHLPLLLNKDRSKLSKRHGSVAVEDFRSQGYMRDAFVNFIALLGWNPTSDREIFSIDELIESFSLEKVNKGGAVFDTQKLDWMNGQYLRIADLDTLTEMAKPVLQEAGYTNLSDEYIKEVVDLLKERIHFIHEIPTFAPYMFEELSEYEKKYFDKRWNEESEKIVRDLLGLIKATEDFSHENLSKITKQYVEDNEMKLGVAIHPLRLMITGKSVGAGMFETMQVLGKATCVNRMELFLDRLANNQLVLKEN